jgi:transposase
VFLLPPLIAGFNSCDNYPNIGGLSNGKSKGKGNRKNGNKYLSWAFVEATQFTRRHNTRLKRYYDRKAAQRNPIVATKALSNKLARICYYIMRDQVPFHEKLLSG